MKIDSGFGLCPKLLHQKNYRNTALQTLYLLETKEQFTVATPLAKIVALIPLNTTGYLPMC